MDSNKFFIEVDCYQLCEKGQSISGDVYLQKRSGDRIIQVLSDGAGSGIKANVIASVISSMAIGYTYADEPVLRAAKAVVDTFARGKHLNDVKQATFTIIDTDRTGHVKIVEFENPPRVLLRNGDILPLPRTEHIFRVSNGRELSLYITEFDAQAEDRIVIFSDGVSLSGYATRRMPFGWGKDGVLQMLQDTIKKKNNISASELVRKVINQAETNDLFAVKNDMSCAAVYFRQPRKILVSSGPPFNAEKDKELADMIARYDGDTIISGGTTAQIIARELNREISVVMKRDPSGLPPISTMKGVTLITEGVLTLARVKTLLDLLKSSEVKGNGTDAVFVRMLLSHDIIEFVVGTRINSVHQDPNLPVELDLRRNVIKDIARQLEVKFMKEVSICYL